MAIRNLEEAIELDEYYYQGHFELFRLYQDSGLLSKALGVLQDMQNMPAAEHKDLTKLSSAIMEFSRWDVDEDFMESLFRVAFETVFPALQNATSYTQGLTEMETNAVELHRLYGIALAHYSSGNADECLELQ